MRKVIILAFIAAWSQGYAQKTERLWEEGKLTWNDFAGTPFVSSNNACELNYQLTYFTTKKKIKKTSFLLFQTKNAMNPNISWVKEEYKNDQYLLYNQIVFDILELHRRHLQKTLHRIADLYLAEDKFRTHYEACQNEIKKFESDTNTGKDRSALNYWEGRIKRELEITPLEVVPDISDRNFGYGMNRGVGSGRFTNTISDHFSPTFNFLFGFDVAFKNYILFLNATLAGNSVKSEFPKDGRTWPSDLRTRVAIIDLSVGYPLIDNSLHRLTPFAGFGVLEFTTASDAMDYEDHRIVNYGLIYGLNYDLKFRKMVRLTPPPFSGNYRERIEHNIRVRFYATSASFDQFAGTSLNLTLGYALFGRLINID